jgi:exopolysaccharide production protein ExoZ
MTSSNQLPAASRKRSPTDEGRLAGVQILRAVAAVAVVIAHLPNSWQLTACVSYGAVGVDIFFVISGFIIVYASRELFTARSGWLRFLCRRLARIVPLYWGVTTLAVAISLIGHPDYWSYFFVPSWIVSTYLFLPFDGRMPMVAVGWTLNFEMLFYAVFAVVIWLKPSVAVLTVGVLFGFAAILHRLVPDLPPLLSVWTNPITGEFVFGAGLALIYLRGIRLPAIVSLGLLCAGIAGFSFACAHGYYAVPINDPWVPRPFAWGIPALAIVAAAALPRTPLRLTRLVKAGARLGDASYCIYLIHPLVIYIFIVYFPNAFLKPIYFGVEGIEEISRLPTFKESTKIFMAQAGECLCLLIIIVFLSLFIFKMFERPVMIFLRRRLEPTYRPVTPVLAPGG